MAQTFIILRNNQQLGPYSTTQLQGLHLQPSDLVWVEGQSWGWQTASSVPELNNLLGVTPAATSKTAVGVDAQETIYFPATQKTPSSKIKWPILIVLGVAAGAAFSFYYFDKITNVAIAPQAVSITPVLIDSSITDTGLVAENNLLSTVETNPVVDENLPFQQQNTEYGKNSTTITTTAETETIAPADEIDEMENSSAQSPTSSPTESVKETPASTTSEEKNETKPNTTEQQPEPEKKKSVLKKIDDWVLNNPVLTPQRKETVIVPVTEGIKLHLRVDQPEFMMGIKGARVVLQNNSNAVLQEAKVSVLYYNEEGSLLEKKTVTIGRVKKGATAVVPAPDHRTAARAEVELLAAEGIVAR